MRLLTVLWYLDSLVIPARIAAVEDVLPVAEDAMDGLETWQPSSGSAIAREPQAARRGAISVMAPQST